MRKAIDNTRRFRLSAMLFLPALLLKGCSILPGAEKAEGLATLAVVTGAADRKSYNDQKADMLLQLPCDISIGAYFRLQNAVQQEALSMLCSGNRLNEVTPPLAPISSR